MKLVIDIDEEVRISSAKVATCSDCKYFIQHYMKCEEYESLCRFREVNMGHCTYPRNKNREPGTPACGYFELKE